MQMHCEPVRHDAGAARGSYAERARGFSGYDYDQEDLYADDLPLRRTSTMHGTPHGQNSKAHRIREPQAALHVPSSGRYPMEAAWTGPTLPKDGHADGDSGMALPRGRPDSPTLNVTSSPTPASRSGGGPVQGKSPLQRLEGKLDVMSKDEKRARMEAAEYRAAQRTQKQHLSVDTVASRRNVSHTTRATSKTTSTTTSTSTQIPTRHATNTSTQVSTRPATDASTNRTRTGTRDSQESSRDDRHGEAPKVNRSGSERAPRQSSAGEPVAPRSQRYAASPMEAAYAMVTSDGGILDDAPSRKSDVLQAEADHQRRHASGRRLQKTQPRSTNATSGLGSAKFPNAQTSLHGARTGRDKTTGEGSDDGSGDRLTAAKVRDSEAGEPNYKSPPQTQASVKARETVDASFAKERRNPPTAKPTGRGQFVNRLAPFKVDEFRSAETARLELDDLALDAAITRASREEGPSRRSSKRRTAASHQGALGDAQGYRPALYVRCGPLLRYTGMRRERKIHRTSNTPIEREIWRGSVMIVTSDQLSDYSPPPILRLFAQPMELLPPPPAHHRQELSAEYVDPVAGQIRPTRMGQVRYVKPIEAIPEAVDLSRDEGENGLFESHCSSTNKSRLRPQDGESLGRFKEIRGVRLHVERELTFWRFNIEVELGISQSRIAYRINEGPATGFWVPARGSTMNIMFHSCNGFSLTVDSDKFSGPDPLWRDVLNSHAIKPYHVMLGGGDQLYNDCVTRETEHFAAWLRIKNADQKRHAEFTKGMQDELESFYLNRYAMWFSQGLFGLANSQIPMVNLWDDHDIIDGFGSYPHDFMSSKVFTGLGAVAFKYYMLFQHQSVPAETYHDEPSWLLGASPGPYIHYPSRNVFMFLGRRVAFLGLDCRTERARDEILCQGTYDQVFHRCRAEITKGETKHLIVMLTVPIAYPRLNFLENVLTSRAMDPIKAIGRTGTLGGFVNRFDGGVEILDDLDDHWTSKYHKQERNWFIQELQELAAEKSIRITILGGDVHLAAVGRFYTRKALRVSKDRDHRYMANVISSAIVNTPPPVVMSDVLQRRNKVHHLDHETDEDMIPLFPHDVDGKTRKNKILLPRRNYCTIREYQPGSTPPHTPTESESSAEGDEMATQDRRRYPPGSMSRSQSLAKDNLRPRNIIRRLSGSRERQTEEESRSRRFSFTSTPRRSEDDNEDSYFTQRPHSTHDRQNVADQPQTTAAPRPMGSLRRRLSEPTRRKTDAEHFGAENDSDHPDNINLDHGLDICLNMEISQQDPSGATVPYRLLVPALYYTGQQDANTTRFQTRRTTLMNRIRGRAGSRRRRTDDTSDSGSMSGPSRSPSPQRQGQYQGHRAEKSSTGSHRPTHADDRLQFADAVPTTVAGIGGNPTVAGIGGNPTVAKDGRRDSRNTEVPGIPGTELQRDSRSHPQQLEQHTGRPVSQDKQTRFEGGHQPGDLEGMSDGTQSYDDRRTGRRSVLLEGLKRRFSRRGRYDEEDFPDSASDSEDGYMPEHGHGADGHAAALKQTTAYQSRVASGTTTGPPGTESVPHQSVMAGNIGTPRHQHQYQQGQKTTCSSTEAAQTLRYPSLGHASAARHHSDQRQERQAGAHPDPTPSEGFSDYSDDHDLVDDAPSYETRHMGAMQRVRRFLGGKRWRSREDEYSDDDEGAYLEPEDSPSARVGSGGGQHLQQRYHRDQQHDQQQYQQTHHQRQESHQQTHDLFGPTQQAGPVQGASSRPTGKGDGSAPSRSLSKANRLLGTDAPRGIIGNAGSGLGMGDIVGRRGLATHEQGYVNDNIDLSAGDSYEERKGNRRSWQIWKR